MRCNQSGKPPSNWLKQRNRLSIKYICNGVIKFQYINKGKKDKIKVIQINPHHTNTCQPRKDQLVIVCTAAGSYTKFSSTVLKDLIKLIDLNHFVTSRIIRELLQRALPKRKHIFSKAKFPICDGYHGDGLKHVISYLDLGSINNGCSIL